MKRAAEWRPGAGEDSLQVSEYQTDGSQPITLGDVIGGVELVEYQGTDGGYDDPEIVDNWGECIDTTSIETFAATTDSKSDYLGLQSFAVADRTVDTGYEDDSGIVQLDDGASFEVELLGSIDDAYTV